jgi:hypothetical protein
MSNEIPPPDSDKKHTCGCVTVWMNHVTNPPSLYYRRACTAHRAYAGRLGILMASS